jgi:hypothetical protein
MQISINTDETSREQLLALKALIDSLLGENSGTTAPAEPAKPARQTRATKAKVEEPELTPDVDDEATPAEEPEPKAKPTAKAKAAPADDGEDDEIAKLKSAALAAGSKMVKAKRIPEVKELLKSFGDGDIVKIGELDPADLPEFLEKIQPLVDSIVEDEE